MSEPNLSAAALRGAVDLSSLGRPAPAAPTGAGTPEGTASGGLRIDLTDEMLEQVLEGTMQVPALAVVWSSQHPETQAAVDNALVAAQSYPGRLRVVSIDIQQARMTAGALQVQQVPVTLGLVGARPVPIAPGVQPVEALTQVIEQLLQLAAQSGVTGTFTPGDDDAAPPPPPPLPPAHQAAYDAIDAGDLDGAITAYQDALRENPGDTDAALGLSQVKLLKRTTGVDHIAARRAAAADPTDLDAAMLVADLDVLGGHVEDGFLRLIDLIRSTQDDDRDRLRAHLVDLFDIIGASDERVVKARRSLMSALF